MIKLLTFDDLFPPLRLLKLLVELRRLSRFATKMTLVHGSWAVLSIEKISYSKSSSSQNLKLSIIDTSVYAGTIVPRSNLYWVTRKIELTFASDQWSSRCNGLLYIYFCPHQRLITLRFTAVIWGATFDKKSMVFSIFHYILEWILKRPCFLKKLKPGFTFIEFQN